MAQDFDQMRVYQAGPAALVARLCDALKIPDIIDSVVEWDPAQCRLSPGTRIKALLINLLVDRRALYQVAEFYEGQDMEVLFGPEKRVLPEELNDDALGRALDKLFASDLKKLFSTIALAAASHGVSLTRLHTDTTSISVQGAYEGDEGELEITYGYSKDHRPDLKQFLLGLAVNESGLPVLGQSLAGNQSDKTWYAEVIEELAKTFSPEKLKEIVFVADCALVTSDNLEALAQKEIQFISRLPESFALAEEVKEQAFREGNWIEAGKLAARKGAAFYRVKEFVREIAGRSYRLIVVYSTALDERKEKSLAKKWQKQREELERAAKELAQRPFACEADAQKAIELFVKEHRDKPFCFAGQITREIIAAYPKPGRPKKQELPKTTPVYYADLQISEDQRAMEEEKQKASTFILITSLLDAKKHPAAEILREYKEQNSVERGFRFLKNPFLLGPIFLKSKARVEAMAFVFELALLIAAYFEYRVRKSLKTETAPLILRGKRKSTNPTAKALLEMLDDLLVAKKGPDRILVNHHGPEVIRTLELAGFGKDIYLYPSHTGG